MKMDLNFPENYRTKIQLEIKSLSLILSLTMLTVLCDKMCVTHAVLPVPGLPEMYMLPGFFFSMRGVMKFSMTASSLSLQKIFPGVEV